MRVANRLAFANIQIDLISVWGTGLDLIPVKDEMDWVVVWVVENELVSVWWIGTDLFFCVAEENGFTGGRDPPLAQCGLKKTLWRH